MKIISIGAGTKCLGASAVSPNGQSINDAHAEVLARRALIKFFLDHLKHCLDTMKTNMPNGSPNSVECETEFSSPYFELTTTYQRGDSTHPSITFHPHLHLIFFTSHVPCGDATIAPKSDIASISDGSNQTAAEQEMSKYNSDPGHSSSVHNTQSASLQDCFVEPPAKLHKSSCSDTTTILDIHRTGAKPTSTSRQDSFGSGVSYHETGLFRTKPGRGERTLSMSCSDKLLKWIYIGVQGSLLGQILSKPIFIDRIIISGAGYNPVSLTRALWGRINVCDITDNLLDTTKDESSGSSIHICEQNKPVIEHSDTIFEFGPCANVGGCSSDADNGLRPMPGSVAWQAPADILHEIKAADVLVDGYLLGTTKKNMDNRKCWSRYCRRNMAELTLEVIRSLFSQTSITHNSNDSAICKYANNNNDLTYRDLKKQAIEYHEQWDKLKLEIKHWVDDPRKEAVQRFSLS